MDSALSFFTQSTALSPDTSSSHNQGSAAAAPIAFGAVTRDLAGGWALWVAA